MSEPDEEAYKRSRVETTVTKVNEQLENGGREGRKRSYDDAYARLESWVASATANKLNTIETTLYLDNNSNSSSDDGDDDDDANDNNDNNDGDEDNEDDEDDADDEYDGAEQKDERVLIDVNEANHSSNEEDYQDE